MQIEEIFKIYFEWYLNWYSEQLDFLRNVILPIVVASCLGWYLSNKSKKN